MTYYLFPFDKVPKNSNIVLYGAGNVGKQFYDQVTETNFCEIVLWLDKKADGILVKQPETITGLNTDNYDFAIIAIENETIVSNVKNFLINYGVPENKILHSIHISSKFRSQIENKKQKTLNLISNIKPLQNKKTPQYIVSLTSYGKRLTDTAPYAIATLFNQTIQPNKIVLWVAHEDRDNIPKIMEKLMEKGLEIKFCENIKSYKKLIPALQEFPDDYIITADDDLYYPQNWFEQLMAEHKKNPNKIICHRAHGIRVDENNNLLPYDRWSYCIESTLCSYNIFPTGVGGVLYPPKCFYNNIANKELFMKLAPMADDIWFWAMAVINKEYFGGESPYIIVGNGYSQNLRDIEPQQQQDKNALWNYNVSEKGNDKQLKAVIEQYPQIKEYLQKIKPIKSVSVSLIIPVYNAAQWIERCFISIKKQICENNNIEAIFVDDCSTDNSVEILKNLIKNYNGKIKFNLVKHTEEEKGFARDTGIKKSKGDYIYHLDADDEITENALQELTQLAQKYPNIDIVQGNTVRIEAIKNGWYVINPTWDISKYNFPEFVNDKLWIKERLAMWIRGSDYIPHSIWNKLIRKKFITENNLYSGKINCADDQLWNFWASKKVESIAFSNYYSYIYHREHISVNTQTSDKEKLLIPHIELCETILKNLDSEIAQHQINLVKGLLNNHIKWDLGENVELRKKYSDRIQQINNMVN